MSGMRSALCAFCRRQPVDPAWRPFCSERCKLQDLARWADGAYRIPGDHLTDPDDPDNPEPHTEN
jgi:endogenous inhibitor of DNA gyrase (YacG/DUF329 family)